MKKKTLIIAIILITIINTIIPVANAALVISEANLINDHKINTHLLYYNDQRQEWRDIQCGYICYKTDGEKFPAYCITPNTNGVDEEGSYTVTVNSLIDDKLIYNILINGYPYKTPSQLGVQTSDDAYVATKLALKNALLNRDVSDFYRATDARGEEILTAMFEIIKKGKAGNALNKETNLFINKVGEFIESEDYYYQEYSVTADVNISEYIIKNVTNFPEGSYITDTNRNEKEKFLAGENFRIMIPKSRLNKDISGEISITATCNSKPIFYGEAPNSNIQDYAITYKPYVEYNTSTILSKDTKTASIKIVKQDEETLRPIENVVFALYNQNDEYITSQTTNPEGIAVFSSLYQGKYRIKEITENSSYIKDDTVHEVTTEYNKEVCINITNKHKKGNLKITKVDKDDQTITLGAIEFDLIDDEGKVVKHFTTDVNGEVYIENINTGTYTLRETLTKKEYNLCVDENIVVNWNETSNVIIENEKKKGQIKIIKKDAQNEKIKLEGVKFQIIDINNKVVEEIETDSNGEAISSRLLIGEYKIKEIDLGNNTNYLLNNETYTIQVENNTIAEIVVENEHKKGNLKIKKVDKDNSNIILEGVKFEITDKDGYIYERVTNKDGIAEVNNIRIGKVQIKEMETNEDYVLSKEIYGTEIEYDKCIEIAIENEKKKGKIEIHKVDEEDNSIKIPNVEFAILDKNNEVVDKIITDENGKAISRKLPIGEYYLKEVKTNNKYLLNEEIIKFSIKEEKNTILNIKNKKIKGKIQIIKTSSNDSPILNIKQGQVLEGIKFEVYNSKNELVDTLITDEAGQAVSKELEFGRYKVVEKSTNKYYILDTGEYIVNINRNNEIKVLDIQNEAIIPKLDIEKTGQQFAEKNEEIKYEFDIKNISNTKLNNFTWTEYIPYEECKITKMVTGIYSENIDYDIYYKTNKSEYKLLKTINSLTSEYINFDELDLDNKEEITEIKVEYKTVSKDFNAIVKPCIFTKIDNDVKKDDKIVNVTNLFGNVEEYTVEDESRFETIIIEKEILKKLPKTGC